jgi:hypothetical protein
LKRALERYLSLFSRMTNDIKPPKTIKLKI